MSDLTLDEKAGYAAMRAKEIEAERHFYDLYRKTFSYGGYSVGQRDTHHWDVSADQVPGKAEAHEYVHGKGTIHPCPPEGRSPGRERAFAIRGEPGEIYVRDERWNPHKPFPRESLQFRSVMAAMLWISEELMQPARSETKRGPEPR